jgi:hypothetical protein
MATCLDMEIAAWGFDGYHIKGKFKEAPPFSFNV